MSALIAAMALTFSHCAFADSHGAFTGTCPITDETPAIVATYSIYCAGEKAVEEITGGTGPIEHRRPAMEVIRGIVDDRAAKRNYKHRLMDYNNDPETTIDDVRRVFQDALRRASGPTRLSRHGFAS